MSEQAKNPTQLSGAVVPPAPPPIPDFSGKVQRLLADPIEGYHLAWINDTPGNIEQMMSMGYALVSQDEQPRFKDAPRVAGRGDDPGTHVRVYVGAWLDSGQPTYAYLMKVNHLLYEEGMRKLEERNAAVRADIERRVKGGQVPGESNFYAQKGNSIKESKSPT